MEIRAFGPTAWFADDVDDPIAWVAELNSRRVDGIIEIVPAERTVVVVCERQRHGDIGSVIAQIDGSEAVVEPPGHRSVEVVYDGPDLATTADALGLSVEELIRRHTSATYTVAFCGFSPGFAYLRGLDPALRLPRRTTPRTQVPAGSVAIAAGYSCVYPSSSPGGWHLLGRTAIRVFDVDRAEPALLRPGMTVSFTELPG
ncbi:MAG: allophanate hydrolase subunit 1 [Ilumatobacteraceae bacterium]